jgi:transposase
MESIPSKDIVYIDESGIDSCIHRPFGRAPRGQKVYGEISGRRFARESFVAGLCGGEILAPFCYQGTCNTDLFNMWVDNCLIPVLKKGQVVVLDNATFHKSESTKKRIEDAGCSILFLPPYSPDLNPIEIFWANLKAKIRRIIDACASLQQAVDLAFRSFFIQTK